ncbi:hypothetical protein CYLTODRAFT_426379 [Cylindrobasidium torrendii FP15055 ss-10]|uniref:Yeast cell wall synthesis Kre9/Knh1-like N-terminal domain-containing protein n=1 Tax=Cylindrobasidium torrendii FP15055 ss-10 TaxID=1314674 RepID=A0A0D7B0P8_9AGAR|nr:hypothetical protein CYLTODRAFT_426379 [Cylindrobasidium torrendii FP15055 ss-10]
MFTQLFTSTILLSLSLSSLVLADVNPTTPDGSSIYKEGEKCEIAWTGDASGAWADMTIQLMSGDNFQMVPTTTVATAQDGNKDGTYEYTCPEVTPNSKIYFYQFTAPGAKNTTWTTRWTLASADGSTTEPANSTQPGGASIPWGVGALDDASQSSAAPAGQSSASASGQSGSASASSVTTSARSAAASASDDAEEEDSSSSTKSQRTSTRTSGAANASSTSEPDGGVMMMGSRGLQVLAAGVLLATFL